MSGVVEGNATDGDERQRGVKLLEAYNWIRVGLRLGRENGADRDVVNGLGRGGFELLRIVCGDTKTGMRANDTTGFYGWEIILADVQAKAEEGCVIGTVVEDEIFFAFGAGLEGDQEVAVEISFMTDLNPVCSGVDCSIKGINEEMPVLGDKSRVQDWIEAHYSCIGA